MKHRTIVTLIIISLILILVSIFLQIQFTGTTWPFKLFLGACSVFIVGILALAPSN